MGLVFLFQHERGGVGRVTRLVTLWVRGVTLGFVLGVTLWVRGATLGFVLGVTLFGLGVVTVGFVLGVTLGFLLEGVTQTLQRVGWVGYTFW